MDKEKRTRAEEIKYQAEHYVEVPLWSSQRGRAAKLVTFFAIISTVIFAYYGYYALVVLNIFLSLFFLFFLIKGKQWAIISLIVIYSADMLIRVYWLMLAEQILFIFGAVYFWLILCRSLSNALGVEQLRSKMVDSK